jgi:hypothetical protein
MDYTIIGGEVNLAARLQSHADPGGILISHETWAMVKDIVRAEERDPIAAKGFSRPVRNYAIAGDDFDNLLDGRQVIRQECDGLKIFLDLDKLDKVAAAKQVEAILLRLRR